MANAMQGIMALEGAPGRMEQGPRPADMPTQVGIDQSLIDPRVTQYARSNPQEFSGDMLEGINQADPRLVYEMRSALAGMQLPPEVVDALSLMVDLLLQDPGNYEANRAAFISEGVPEELLPEKFDAAFLAGLQVALNELSRNVMPQRFARGGIVELKPLAKAMAQMGRNGDTMLAHITPGEARLLRVMGGSGTTNPYTGLPEFFLKKLAKAVGDVVSGTAKAVGSVVKGAANIVKEVAKPIVNVVKKVASSPIGKIALTVAAVYFMGPAGLNVAGSLGMTGATALGVNTFLGSTAVNLASGQKFKDAIRGGAISGLTAGAFSAVTGVLPSGYGPVPAGAEPLSTLGDYASSADAAALDAAAAREAADFAASGAASAAAPAAAAPASAISAADAADINRILAPGVNVPTVPLSATGVTAPTVTPPAVPSAFQNVVAGNAPAVDVTLGTGAGAIPTPADVASNLQAAGVAPGTAANLAGEALAGTGAAPAPVSLLDRGIGAIRGAYDTVAQPVKNFYNEYLSPSRDMPSKTDIIARARDYTAEGMSFDKAFDLASKELTPSLISQYGPMALAGTAALAATGAFTPKQPGPPGVVDQTYMKGGSGPAENIGIGGVRTVGAPGTRYDTGTTDFFSTASQFMPSQTYAAPQFRVRNPQEYLDLAYLTQGYAKGGIASLSKPRTYPRKTGAINGPGTETSDSIPALLSDGEFVFTAKAVRGAGGGSRRAGAKRMYAMMKALEKRANG